MGWSLPHSDQLLGSQRQRGVTGISRSKIRSEKRLWVLKGPLQVHTLWLHKDQRLVSLVLVLMIALLVY